MESPVGWQNESSQKTDTYFDLALVAIICSVIGARVYYVIFRWDLYKDDLLSVFNLRQGGLAIYGGVIAAIITVFVFSRVRKLSMGLLCDTAGLGLVLGQVIGRWGNFFNREAFGGYTDGLFAMQLPLSAVRSSDVTDSLLQHVVEVNGISYIQVHPTFLYESLWNLILLILLILFTRHKRFDGEVFLLYLAGYGIGRFWIESLRTDNCCCRSSDIRCLWHLQHFLWSYRFPGSSSGMSASTKKQHNVHLDGKILHTFPRVEDFFGKNGSCRLIFKKDRE